MSTPAGEDVVPSSQEDTTSFNITVDLRLSIDEVTTSYPPTAPGRATQRALAFQSDSYCLEPSGSKPTEWKITHRATPPDSSNTPGPSPGTNSERGLYSVAGRQSTQSQSGQFLNGLLCTTQ